MIIVVMRMIMIMVIVVMLNDHRPVPIGMIPVNPNTARG